MKVQRENRLSRPSRAQKGNGLAKLRLFVADQIAAKNVRLPPEPELCEILDIPRNQLRQALKQLEAEGLIWRHVGRGTFIGQRNLATEGSGLVGLVNPQDVMEARLLVEPNVAKLAATRATAPDLVAMQQCLEKMHQERASYWEWRIWDEQLHRLIATAARNPMLLAVVDLIRANTEAGLRERMEQIYRRISLDEPNVEHTRIVAAIADRDPQSAERFMHDHLVSVRGRLFGDR